MKIWLYCSQEMSPTLLAPRSFLEVPVNSERGGCRVVAEEGVPGREGLGKGVGTLEPESACPTVHMCVCLCVCVCMCNRLADKLQVHCEHQG